MPTGVYEHKPHQGFQEGHKSGYFKGKLHSEETKRKISEARKGTKMSESAKEKLIKRMKGNKYRLGVIAAEETREKMRQKIFTTETRLKLSLSSLGDKNPQWRGGVSFEPYSVDWTQKLKESIRKRDRYKCQLCSKRQKNRVFPIHHIDYNKKNCSPENLITLCNSCHSKTNHNRKYWINYFNLVNQYEKNYQNTKPIQRHNQH